MAGNLENELAVSTFIQELIRRQSPDRQSAEDERPGTEAEILIGLLAFQPNLFNALSFPGASVSKSEQSFEPGRLNGQTGQTTDRGQTDRKWTTRTRAILTKPDEVF